MRSKSELKRFFENGSIPGQERFWEWMDSYWHKEETLDADSMNYSNPLPTKYAVGGIPAGTSFDKMPIQELLDFILYGKEQCILTITTTPVDATVKVNGVEGHTITVYKGAKVTYTIERAGYYTKTASIVVTADMSIHETLEADLSNTEIRFKVKTTKVNERVPVTLLRTADTQTVARIIYGDGQAELIAVPTFNGSQSWTDNEGNVHYIDNGNTFYHVFNDIGEYEVTIQAGANVSYVRFCESLIAGPGGYLSPSINNSVQEISKFRSDSITNLDYTFAGLSQANVSTDFQLETPQVTTMNATFYGFGVSREFNSFPATMLAQITKPVVLRGTFFRAGLKKILPGFLDSFSELVSVFECFKNSKLGKNHYNAINAGQYPAMAVDGTNDFIPVSLFWNNPKLKNISHAFNYIGEGWFGNLSSGYLAYFVIRRELLWNGKSAGNSAGTIEQAFYAFAKCNRIMCEPNLLKHSPAMVHLGGLFTQTNQMQHAVAWGIMIPVAARETHIYKFAVNDGHYSAIEVVGKGLTFDLRVMFPEVSYPLIKSLTGAFTVSSRGDTIGFQHKIDYTPNGLPAKLDLRLHGANFLTKFPNAKVGSVDDSAKLILGQSGGTEEDKRDGRHGIFYLLDQDDRITDKTTLPGLTFNNAIPF